VRRRFYQELSISNAGHHRSVPRNLIILKLGRRDCASIGSFSWPDIDEARNVAMVKDAELLTLKSAFAPDVQEAE
jgi:hypothetical protein